MCDVSSWTWRNKRCLERNEDHSLPVVYEAAEQSHAAASHRETRLQFLLFEFRLLGLSCDLQRRLRANELPKSSEAPHRESDREVYGRTIFLECGDQLERRTESAHVHRSWDHRAPLWLLLVRRIEPPHG